MAAIAHSYSAQTTRQSVTGTTYTTVLSHASGNFVAGGKYLVLVHALVDPDGATNRMLMRTAHNGTAFVDSEYSLEGTNAAKRYHYFWFKVWTVPATPEAINFQIANSAAAGVTGADQITIFAMRLDVDLVENTDWFFAEVATDAALSTTPLTSGASVTFTPPASTDWLVLTTAQLDVSSLTVNYGSRIFSSGTFNETSPSGDREGEDGNDLQQTSLARVFIGLGAVSQTFREESYNKVGASGNRFHSAIFALNLNKFAERAVAWTETEAALSGTDWATAFQTGIGITPAVAGDVWILASAVFDNNSVGTEVECRLQVDDTDQPDTQTSDLYQEEEAADNIDELPVFRQAVVTLTAAAHTIDWEGSTTSLTGTPGIEDRSLVAITMELAGGGGGGGATATPMHYFRRRRAA